MFKTTSSHPHRVAPAAFKNGDPAMFLPLAVDGVSGELIVDRHGARVTWIVDEHEYTIAGGISGAFRIVALLTSDRVRLPLDGPVGNLRKAELEAIFGKDVAKTRLPANDA